MNKIRKNIVDKAEWASEWGGKHLNQGVIEASQKVREMLKEKDITDSDIIKTEAYKTCVRVWYK